MCTTVEYTLAKPPLNLYPWHIVSPPQSGPCCFSSMQALGDPRREGRWEYAFRRCTTCGFTVRVILREFPDAWLLAGLRETFATVFRRNEPDL